jgi:hypothetical protein
LLQLTRITGTRRMRMALKCTVSVLGDSIFNAITMPGFMIIKRIFMINTKKFMQDLH